MINEFTPDIALYANPYNTLSLWIDYWQDRPMYWRYDLFENNPLNIEGVK